MKQPQNTILIGDCREQLRRLPDNSVHCIVTSPPYWALRSYLPTDDPAKRYEIGSEPTVKEFIRTLVGVFAEARRVLRDDGTCWVNLGDTYMQGKFGKQAGLKNKDLIGIPWRFAFAMQEAGWWLRSDIIWHKPNPVPEPDRGKPTVAHEYVFLFTKSARYFYDNDAIRESEGDEPTPEEYLASLGSNNGADASREKRGYQKCSHNQTHPNGRQKRTVWKIPTAGFKGSHYATFPKRLVEPCILAGTSEQGACVACGCPKRRLSEVTPEYAAKLGKGWHDHKDDGVVGQRGVPSAFRDAPARVTTGWVATCGCGVAFEPCTVLDMFGGTGTVAEVAMQYGRSAIMIDLDSRNERFMQERTGQQRLGFLA